MSHPFVNEGSLRKLTVTFLDEAGQPAVPAAVSYRIDCLTSGTVIKTDTSVTPAASLDITIPGADNALVDQANSRERRRVTVTATYADGDEHSYFDYWIKNLSGVE